jgi:futalosine hydrolase
MSLDVILLCATDGEADAVRDAMTDRVESAHAMKLTHHGLLYGEPCRLAVTGVAATNTAQALTREVEASRPRLVIQFGIGGAYPRGGLRVGDLAVASEEHYGDVGVEAPDGWMSMDDVGFPLVDADPPLHNRMPIDGAMAARVGTLLGATVGPFVTVNRCSGLSALGEELYARTLGICESMEGAAAAHVCALYELPFIEVRAASNMVEDRDRSRWRVGPAVAAITRATLSLMNHLAEVEEPE